MEKITKHIIVAFINQNEIELIPTHTKLCVPVVNRIYKKMIAGINFSPIKVHDNLICDGHHRFLASILSKFYLERIPGTKTSATIPLDWKSVIFEEEDWDTSAKK